MKYIKLFENFKDSLGIYDREQNWLNAIYVTYMEQEKHFGKFIHVTKDEFYKNLYETKLDRIKTIEYDTDRVYRLADSKKIWLGKYGTVLGEVWQEDDMVSYWIKSEYYK